MKIVVTTRKGTEVCRKHCDKGFFVVGKSPECLVVLNGWRIAREHLRIEQREKGLFVKPLDKKSQFSINERRQESEYGPLKDGDRVVLGDYILRVKGEVVTRPLQSTEKLASELDPQDTQRHELKHSQTTLQPDTTASQQSTTMPVLMESALDRERFQLEKNWKIRVHNELIQTIDLRRVNVSSLGDEELRDLCSSMIDEILNRDDAFPENQLDKTTIARQVLSEAIGLGPLEDLIADPDISEVMVNSSDEIYYEKSGKLIRSKVCFSDDRSVLSAIERIVSPLGRRIDESSPMVDARLKDGSRVNAIIPPLALKGPTLTIRKFMQEKLTMNHLKNFGSVSAEMVEFLEMAVGQHLNIIISGGTGSGKTTLLNALSNFIPHSERIITVEDAAELKLNQPHVVSLEARPPNQEGSGAVTIRDLVKNCLRMRPDRIVVGECRGGEALDMLQAMNTGHDGSLTTVHSNSPRDCVSRLEVLVLMSGMDLPVIAIREQISSAVNLIVQQTRFACGTRKVTSIAEVTGVEGSTVQISEIFRFKETGFDEQGKVIGMFEATGNVPEFYEKLSARGISVNLRIFDNKVMGL